ncbi:MAG: hypothetical protein U0841_02050 [Chloroflexia bacterium]
MAATTPFFSGRSRPCINGQVAAAGAYFGQDVQGIIERLLGEQLPDGGWNCEAENGSTRSSGFQHYDRARSPARARTIRQQPEVTKPGCAGKEYLLERRLFRRKSTGGEVIAVTARGAPPGPISPSRPGGTTTCCAASNTCAVPTTSTPTNA